MFCSICEYQTNDNVSVVPARPVCPSCAERYPLFISMYNSSYLKALEYQDVLSDFDREVLQSYGRK